MPQNQKGFAPILIVVIIAAVALIGGLLLYKGGNLPVALPSLSGARMLSIASEKDFANISDPVLKKHFVAQSNVAAMRATSLSSGKGTTNITEYESSGNDFKFRWIEKDGDKEMSHLISIGDITYVKDYSDNKWWKQVAKPEKNLENNAPEKPEDLKDELLKENPLLYKQIGQEACGSLTCYKYEQTFKDSPGKRTFWFDTKYYLLRKETSGYGEFSVDANYSYDNISILAPSPTKDVPEGKSVYDYFNQVQAAPAAGAPSVRTVDLPTLPPETENFNVPQEELPSY